MKKLILILLSFVALNLSAQEKIVVKKETSKAEQQKLTQGNNAKTLAKTETQKLSKQLELTSEQEARVYDIFLNHFENELKEKEKIKTLIKSKNKENREEIKQKIAKQKNGNNEALNSKLKEVLTAKQLEIYQKETSETLKTKQKKLRVKN